MDSNLSKSRLWTSRIMSWLVILFMLFDSIGKFMKPAPVIEGTVSLGFAEHHIVWIGLFGLIPTLLYAIPRTSLLGAVLLTAYFGGVVATQIRMDAPLFTHTLFAVYLAVLAWGGIWLRDENVRKLFPFKTNR
ncbi:DoxX family protein [Paenibacillus spongiae]|uniref:DoxX family protein n=1 Tax=Paenibacillus spongiae TaxID=2909671 RepID=A0ABY5SIK9_9BACL|nr:DoxX family protein [Paenibacillus spongiae]UVI33479.1 DoxX family protein [Paenibacillus spongiae]